MDYVQNNWADIWMILTSVVTIASVVAKLTPNKWDDNTVSKVIKVLSLNKGK